MFVFTYSIQFEQGDEKWYRWCRWMKSKSLLASTLNSASLQSSPSWINRTYPGFTNLKMTEKLVKQDPVWQFTLLITRMHFTTIRDNLYAFYKFQINKFVAPENKLRLGLCHDWWERKQSPETKCWKEAYYLIVLAIRHKSHGNRVFSVHCTK